MLLNCNSCQKKFVVPDSAITKSGRLVQCGSCGNKWTQFPIEVIKPKKITPIKKKTEIRNTRSKKNLYSVEYLKKKHGLDIATINNPTRNTSKRSQKNSYSFYGWVAILFVFLFTLFGILNLTKEIIILKYPLSEIYITYLYEVIDVIKISMTELVKQLKY